MGCFYIAYNLPSTQEQSDTLNATPVLPFPEEKKEHIRTWHIKHKNIKITFCLLTLTHNILLSFVKAPPPQYSFKMGPHPILPTFSDLPSEGDSDDQILHEHNTNSIPWHKPEPWVYRSLNTPKRAKRSFIPLVSWLTNSKFTGLIIMLGKHNLKLLPKNKHIQILLWNWSNS